MKDPLRRVNALRLGIVSMFPYILGVVGGVLTIRKNPWGWSFLVGFFVFQLLWIVPSLVTELFEWFFVATEDLESNGSGIMALVNSFLPYPWQYIPPFILYAPPFAMLFFKKIRGAAKIETKHLPWGFIVGSVLYFLQTILFYLLHTATIGEL